MPKETSNTKKRSRLLPPSDFELAILAALLGQRDGELEPDVRSGREVWRRYRHSFEERESYTRDAMLKAARFYMHAVITREELAGLSEKSLVTLLQGCQGASNHYRLLFPRENWISSGGEKEYKLFNDAVPQWKTIYADDLKGGLDPVRDYLTRNANAFHWKKTKTVLETIQDFFEAHADLCNADEAAAITKFKRQLSQIAAELKMSEANLIHWRFRTDRRLGVNGKKIFEDFIHAASIRPAAEVLAKAPSIGNKTIGWTFTEGFLRTFIRWRNAQRNS